MEWDPIENCLVQIYSIEEENYYISLNQQIDEHLKEELEYELYMKVLQINANNLEEINDLIEYFENNNFKILKSYENWNEITDIIKEKVLNIFQNLSLS